MASKTFRCKIVTPTAALVDDDVTYASIPAWDGMMGVLPGRAPILANLGVGELRLDMADGKGEGGQRTFVVDGGFLKMSANELMILAERAVAAEQVVLADAEAELRGASAGGTDSKSARDQKYAKAKIEAGRKFKGI